MTTAQYFACKLDNCQEWITFTRCPDGFVSTGELNLHQKCMVCKDPSRVNSTDIYQELLPSTKCTASFYQGEVFWCNYENCWFALSGCDENETRTKYQLSNKKIHCLPRQTTTENSDLLTEPPAPTARHSIFQGALHLIRTS
ncbi:hypothetical protein Btru_049118 [Bulinus truncatus]|nr:hypothetical protein Btru_049118 [Bulinus truncatus]